MRNSAILNVNAVFKDGRNATAKGLVTIRRVGRFFLDVAASACSFLLAAMLRQGWSAFKDVHAIETGVLLFSGICAFVYLVTGLSVRSWRFVSVQDIFLIARDVAAAVIVFMTVGYFVQDLAPVAHTIPVIALPIAITTLGAMRVLYRSFFEGTLPFGVKDLVRPQPRSSLLAYGATMETDAFLRALQPGSAYEVVGLIDDDPMSRDRRIRGIEVLGNSAELGRIVESFKESSIDLKGLVLPTSGLPRQKLREIVDLASSVGLRPVRLPHACDLIEKAHEPFAFEPVQMGDLLGREPVALRLESIDALIRGKSVVVTGGGGSIGSELCRQLLRRGPAKLVIIDHSEYNLFQIERELSKVDVNGVVEPILASIRDRDRIRDIFSRAAVDLVFHAAAYKHVPLVEGNPIEGILTNVVGTSNVADAAVDVGATAMIMVSTDKAVKPSSIMGLSKRIAEAYCQATDMDCASHQQRTRSIVVRFGNVLNSSGSVVPIFEQQIKRGGPVTVTDPEMTRYFMTISEAVELVLQGSAYAVGRDAAQGAIMVLDMGDPVPIVELARRMISLAGFVPGKDIDIKYIGVRNGEKLHEELFDENELLETTDMPGIRLAISKTRDLQSMRALREQILSLASSGDAPALVALLRSSLSDASAKPTLVSRPFAAMPQKSRVRA